jgi:UDP-N-acetylmuramate--alanine ligase
MNLFHPFFSGIAGTGMSALAQYLAFQGKPVSGSDRSLDRGAEAVKRAYFEKLGIRLVPQDGKGLEGCSCLVVSTAIESQNPEVQAAQALQIPIVHRSDLLAHLASLKKAIAVSGTSGKSTVSGMVWHVLEAGGLGPSLITGANLNSLMDKGLLGNAKAGGGDWLVLEADESDGSLVKYHPDVALVLNVEKDHKEVAELLPLFRQFMGQAKAVILNQDDPEARGLLTGRAAEIRFGHASIAEGALKDLQLGDWTSSFTLGGVPFLLNVPGRHNVANAMAALAVGRHLGVALEDCARGLAAYKGVERRHVRIGEARGITVLDDFAHNPAKVKACLETVKRAGPSSVRADGKPRRVLALFHPHGFAPMKLMGEDLVAAMAETLDTGDRVFLPEIYYAGGTADKSISSADLAASLNRRKAIASFHPTKDEAIAAVAKEARPGDWVVSMGARDPSLGDFALRLFEAIRTGGSQSPSP